MSRPSLEMSKPITFGSMFAGIGGIDLAFERCGMECRWQVEIDKYANKVLEKHWPNVERWGDVRTFPPDSSSKWKVDVIAGGFPCQDISTAGKGAGLDGEKSGLFYEIIRVARCVKPKAIVLENVAALLARGMGDVLGELAQIGFDAEWHCIPAAALGAPHIRDRVFILGYSNGGCGNGTQKEICTRRLITQLPSEIRNADSNDAGSFQEVSEWKDAEPCGSRSRRRTGQRNSLAHASGDRCDQDAIGVTESSSQAGSTTELSQGSQSRDSSNSSGERWEGCAEESLSRQRNLQSELERIRQDIGKQWAVEPDVGRVAHGVSRRLDRIKGLGNAVVPQVAQVVGEILLKKLSR